MKQEKAQKLEKLAEGITWALVFILVLLGRYIPIKLISKDYFYLVFGSILVFLIIFYYVIWKRYSERKNFYLVNVASVILLGILIVFVKDLNLSAFSLFLLPIASVALALEVVPSVLIIILICSFIAFEVVIPSSFVISALGFWQTILIVIITIIARFLAIEIKHHREKQQVSEVRIKQMKEVEEVSKEFVTLTSHQLFTPLSIIRGFTSLLKSEDLGKINPKQKKAINQIYENTLRMIQLISELLTVSRLGQGKIPFHIEKIELGSLVYDIVCCFEEVAKSKNLELNFKKPKNPLYAEIDQQKTKEAISNLIDNALKYTKEGRVSINVGAKNINGKNETVISVIDTGAGIPEEYKERIFEPFFRGKNILELDKKGTGLGLYIAKMMIENQGGKIWTEDNKPKGAIFSVSFALKDK